MTFFATTLLLFPVLLSSQSPGLALKSAPVIHIGTIPFIHSAILSSMTNLSVTDNENSVFLSHLDSILKRIESSFPVSIQTTRRSHEGSSQTLMAHLIID